MYSSQRSHLDTLWYLEDLSMAIHDEGNYVLSLDLRQGWTGDDGCGKGVDHSHAIECLLDEGEKDREYKDEL